jgi:hypothetical protein
MATIYSLICWGGSSGKSVAVSSSTDYVTLTNHGLHDATGVAFTSGTIPTVSGTALSLNTTYYSKSISSSTFELYYDSGLTSKIDFTSTGYSLIMKSAYYLGLPDVSRWGGGIYEGLLAWSTGRSSASSFDMEVAEIGMGFVETGGVTINIPSAGINITTLVNGARSSGFHNGVPGTGYILSNASASGSTITTVKANSVVDGITCRITGAGYGPSGVIFNGATGSIVKNCFLYRTTYNNAGYGVSANAQLVSVINCVIYGFGAGVYKGSACYFGTYANNIITGCNNGFSAYVANGQYGNYYNNIVIKNYTTNYSSNTGYTAANNAGESDGVGGYIGGAPWGLNSVALLTSDFASYDVTYPYLSDFYPASDSAPQVDSGTDYYARYDYDITDAEVPNYKNGDPEYVDLGCYEYDHGYGPHPMSTTLTFQGVVAGSEIRIYRNSDNVEIAGVESCDANHAFTLTTGHGSACTIKIVNLAYRIQYFQYTIPSESVSLPIEQEPDRWYSNPV